jgi:hypothetical protein
MMSQASPLALIQIESLLSLTLTCECTLGSPALLLPIAPDEHFQLGEELSDNFQIC